MKFKAILAFIAIFAVGAIAIYADTVTSGTLTSSFGQDQFKAFYKRFEMTSDSSGNCVWATEDLTGELFQWFAIPDNTSSATLPTNLFDITLTDVDGIDMFRADGANITSGGATTKFESDSTKLPIQNIGTLTFTGSNMGSTKTLVLKVFYR
jgi:hypothetical protein